MDPLDSALPDSDSLELDLPVSDPSVSPKNHLEVSDCENLLHLIQHPMSVPLELDLPGSVPLESDLPALDPLELDLPVSDPSAYPKNHQEVSDYDNLLY